MSHKKPARVKVIQLYTTNPALTQIEISEQAGISRERVRQILSSAGLVDTRPRSRTDSQALEMAIKLYYEFEPLTNIHKSTGISTRILYYWLETRELPRRGPGRHGKASKILYESPFASIPIPQTTRLRIAALYTLGMQCVKCGESDIRVLQIDHINGGGSIEFKRLGQAGVYNRVLEHPKDYQCLCANCNWKKRIDELGHFSWYKDYIKKS